MPNAMISPGVRVNVVDESQYAGLAGAATNAICIVGAAQMGPTMEPVLLTSTTQFLNTFGTPIDMAGLTATKSLTAGGTIYYVRLADGSEQVKSVILPGSDSTPATTYQVAGVSISQSGSDYAVGDVLSTTNGDTPATFKVISTDGVGTTYSVDTVTIVGGGSGYSIGDEVTIEEVTGTPATLSVVEVNAAQTTWQVTEGAVVSGGTGYAVGETLTIQGTPANAVFVVSSVNATSPTYSLSSVDVSSGGTGYKVNDTLILSGQTDASFKVDEISSGTQVWRISEATISEGGTGYKVNDELTIEGSNSSNFIATVTAVNQETPTYTISEITVTNGGTGYAVDDELTYTGTAGEITCKITAVGSEGVISAVENISTTENYEENPAGSSLKFTGGTGSGAELTVASSENSDFGVITALEIKSNGQFASNPSTDNPITPTGGTGSGAELTVTSTEETFNEGSITQVSIVVPGSFTTDVAGIVTPTGGTGSGVELTVTTEASTYGVVTGVNLQTAGSFNSDPQGVSTPSTSGSGSGCSLNLSSAQIPGGVITQLQLKTAGVYNKDIAGDNISLSGGSGSGAVVSITSEIDTTGGVTSLAVETPGSFVADPAGSGIPLSGGHGTGVTVDITSKKVEVPVGGSNLVLTATSAGTLAEGSWYAIVSGASGGQFTLQVIKTVGTGSPISVVGPTQLSLYSEDSNYFETFTGNGLFTLHSDGAEVPQNLVNSSGSGYELSPGSNGATPDDPDANIPALSRVIGILSDPEAFDFLYITMPVYSSNSTIATQLVSLGKTRDNSVIQIDHPASVENVDEIIEAFTGLAGPSNSQIAMWGGLNLVTIDEYNNKAKIQVPPSVIIIPALAELYSASDPWTPPASVNNLVLNQLISATSFTITERDMLYEANINPITNYRGLGWTAMGQKSGQTKLSALDRLNVRQLVNTVKKRLATMSVDFLFSPIDQQTFDNWTYRANQILSQIAQRRGLYDYFVKLDFETTSQDDINNNLMRPIVQIKPSKTAEYIDIDLIIRNYSDEFNPQ